MKKLKQDERLGKSQDYWDGVEVGKIHAKPSEETKQMLNSLFSKFDLFVQEVRTYHKTKDEVQEKILAQTTATNGRVTELEKWKSGIEYASKTLKILWSVIGIFIVAAVFGIFKMYVEVQKLQVAVSDYI